MASPLGRALALAAIALPSLGCVRGCTSSRPPIHLNPSMDQQPKYKPQAASSFFYDGSAMRKPVEGTIARGELREDLAFYEGKDSQGALLAKIPGEITDAMKARGADRYHIYCTPCHDARGDGKGILFQRGKVPTPSFHAANLLAAGDGHFYNVITNGSGLMPAYRWPIAPADRWAIVAHVRELQQKRLSDSGGAAPPPATAPATLPSGLPPPAPGASPAPAAPVPPASPSGVTP